MKEEEIINQLENVRIPDIELPAYRQELRTALLGSDCFKKQPETGIMEVLRSRVQSGINMMLDALLTRRRVWIVALGSTLVAAVIAALVLVLPSPDGQPSIARAIEIAKSDPQVRAALGVDEDDDIEVTVIKSGPNSITLSCEGKEGVMVCVVVNLDGTINKFTLPLLTDEEKEKAIEIASADPRIREILGRGAIINLHSIWPQADTIFDEETGDPELVWGTLVHLVISEEEEKDKDWLVIVNIISGKVEVLMPED